MRLLKVDLVFFHCYSSLTKLHSIAWIWIEKTISLPWGRSKISFILWEGDHHPLVTPQAFVFMIFAK